MLNSIKNNAIFSVSMQPLSLFIQALIKDLACVLSNLSRSEFICAKYIYFRDEFIIEYIGEVVTQEDFADRVKK